MYSFTKKVADEDVELLKLLDTANAPPRKMAEVISHRTGDSYNSKDVKIFSRKPRRRRMRLMGVRNILTKFAEMEELFLLTKIRRHVMSMQCWCKPRK